MEKKKSEDEIVAEAMRKGTRADELIQQFLASQDQKIQMPQPEQIYFKEAPIQFDPPTSPRVFEARLDRPEQLGDEPELTEALYEAQLEAAKQCP